MEDWLEIAGNKYRSRLIVGTGKYKDFAETKRAIEVSGAEIVTVAVRRVNITDPNKENLLDYLDPKNTRSCRTRPVATMPTTPCELAVWRAKPAWENWSSWKSSATIRLSSPMCRRPLKPRKYWSKKASTFFLTLPTIRLPQKVARHRLRRGHAIGRAYRFRAGHS